jgi:hypothetical protein
MLEKNNTNNVLFAINLPIYLLTYVAIRAVINVGVIILILELLMKEDVSLNVLMKAVISLFLIALSWSLLKIRIC